MYIVPLRYKLAYSDAPEYPAHDATATNMLLVFGQVSL